MAKKVPAKAGTFFALKESINFQLEVNSTQLEILGMQYKGHYTSVFVQGQGAPIGRFSLFWQTLLLKQEMDTLQRTNN